MKLVKYNGHGTYKLKFDCNDLLKKYKGLYLSETGVIAKDEDTTYHFDSDGKTFSICSIVTPTWSKKKCTDKINTVLKYSNSYLKTSYVVFQDNIDLGVGGPEMLHWNINEFQCGHIISNAWEPELYDSLVLRFKKFNDVELNVEIKEDGSMSIVCFPIEKNISVDDLKNEAEQVKDVLLQYLNI